MCLTAHSWKIQENTRPMGACKTGIILLWFGNKSQYFSWLGEKIKQSEVGIFFFFLVVITKFIFHTLLCVANLMRCRKCKLLYSRKEDIQLGNCLWELLSVSFNISYVTGKQPWRLLLEKRLNLRRRHCILLSSSWKRTLLKSSCWIL